MSACFFKNQPFLQEWLKAKEEKEMALLDQEEARIQAAEKAEKARAAKVAEDVARVLVVHQSHVTV